MFLRRRLGGGGGLEATQHGDGQKEVPCRDRWVTAAWVIQGQVLQHGEFDVGEHRPGGQFRGVASQAGECGQSPRLVSSSHY